MDGTERLPMRQIREILRLEYESLLSHRAIAGPMASAWGWRRNTCAAPLARALVGRCRPSWTRPRWRPSAPERERVTHDLVLVHPQLKRTGFTLHLPREESPSRRHDGRRFAPTACSRSAESVFTITEVRISLRLLASAPRKAPRHAGCSTAPTWRRGS